MTILAGKLFLVVDDEEFIREIMCYALEAEGATTKVAGNIDDALALVKITAFDAVISDVQMPGGDGISLIKNIVEQIQPLPKLFLCTGNCHYADQDMSPLGISHVFTKPFYGEEVALKLSQVLATPAATL